MSEFINLQKPPLAGRKPSIFKYESCQRILNKIKTAQSNNCFFLPSLKEDSQVLDEARRLRMIKEKSLESFKSVTYSLNSTL